MLEVLTARLAVWDNQGRFGRTLAQLTRWEELGDTSLLRVLDTYCLREAVQLKSQRWQPGFVEVPHRWEIAS